jgi:hypothetical protein
MSGPKYRTSFTSSSASTRQIPRLVISALKEAAEGSMITLGAFRGPMNFKRHRRIRIGFLSHLDG